MSDFDSIAYNRELKASARAHAAENRRSQRLLALALRTAAGDDCDPSILLQLLAAIDGTDLARPAWVEEKLEEDRQKLSDEIARTFKRLRDLPVDALVHVLRDTNARTVAA